MESILNLYAPGDAGFPDYLAIRSERKLVLEIKSDTGTLTKEQEDWLRAFALCHIEIRIWRPGDDFEAICQILH